MEEIFLEDEVMVFCGRKEVATKLLQYPFDHIFFTGSTAVGKTVMTAAAQNMTSVTMELGGKSPVLVDETADLKDAAEKIVWGKFMNAGQTCVAPDYVLVQEQVYQQFLDLAKETLAGYYGNSETERTASPDFARIIDDRHYRRLKNLIEDSVQGGAKIETGGVPDNMEMYIPPTILTNVPPDSKIMQEEIFGPVLPVLSYHSEDDTLRQMNRNGEPLAVYIFSRDRQKITRIFSRTTSGSGGINEVVIQFIHPNLPFGGIGKSGFGKAHGFYGFETFSNHRTYIKSNRWSPLKLLYPPFTSWKKKIIDILIRYF
jgi:aldehyde dehydrogenase (NAD+)